MGEKKGPMALSFPPWPPYSLPEYKTARAAARAVLQHRNKKAIIIAFLFRAVFPAGFEVFLSCHYFFSAIFFFIHASKFFHAVCQFCLCARRAHRRSYLRATRS